VYRLLLATTGRVNDKNARRSGTIATRGLSGFDSKRRKQMCWDSVHGLLELAVWRQAGEDRAVVIAYCGGQPSGCKNEVVLLPAPKLAQGLGLRA
jgi:hypothetical protein